MSSEKLETISESDWLKGEIIRYAKMLVESDKTNIADVRNILVTLWDLAAKLDEITKRYEDAE